MASGLKRYQQLGHLHFVTFCCYHRRMHLETSEARGLFEESSERIRGRNDFQVIGYVVMPEHIHLLVSEPGNGSLSTAIQAIKQARYYDVAMVKLQVLLLRGGGTSAGCSSLENAVGSDEPKSPKEPIVGSGTKGCGGASPILFGPRTLVRT
jgi:REP element-mobilizing transposase RayT